VRHSPLILLLLVGAAGADASTPPRADPPRAHHPRRAPAPRDGLTATQIIGVMKSLRPEVDRCFEANDRADLVILQLVIGNTGAVSSAHVAGALEDTKTGLCIELAAADVVFPAFTGPPKTLSYPFPARAD
jgi:hypothetical protein